MKDQHKLSIQVSLNGLSFCVLDVANNTVQKSECLTFEKQLTPYTLLRELKQFVTLHGIDKQLFSEVIVIHRNELFGLVPAPYFSSDELANYVKYNSKILENDHIVHDEVTQHNIVIVYVPFTNVNNYVYDLFGAFTFKHHSTVMLETLLDREVRNLKNSAGSNDSYLLRLCFKK